MAQILKQQGKFRGKRRVQTDDVSCKRVPENKLRAMQRLPVHGDRSSSVRLIAEERMADGREMNPDLMSASRLQLKLNQRCVIKRFHDLVMGHRLFSRRADPSQPGTMAVSADRSVDGSLRFARNALNKRQIEPLDRFRPHVLIQTSLGKGVLGIEHRSRRIRIQAMDVSDSVCLTVRQVISRNCARERALHSRFRRVC